MDNFTYYPTLGELAVLIVTVAVLVGGGYLIKRPWTRKGDSVPIPLALILWAFMFLIFFGVTVLLYQATGDRSEVYAEINRWVAPGEDPQWEWERRHRIVILAWCLFFWMGPVAYYSYTIVNSLAMRTVERIGPFSAKIEEPSQFAKARKYALRGDIDSAVSIYRAYTDNQANALFEAARLLKSENRFLEAADLLEEITERFDRQLRVWTEAAWQLAKIQENHLGDVDEAVAVYHHIIERAAETRYGQMAFNDLKRLRGGVDDYDEGEADEAAEAEEEAAAPLVPSMRGMAGEDEGEGGEKEAGDADEGQEEEETADEAALEDLDAGDEEDELTAIPVPEKDPFYRPVPGVANPADGDDDDGRRKKTLRKSRPQSERDTR
jgi:tetratricopeptide (TPR) repeat protein